MAFGLGEVDLVVDAFRHVVVEPDHARIDEDEDLRRILTAGQIDDRDLLGDADLVGRETDARSGVHRLDHVLHEPLQVRRDLPHLVGSREQNFMRVAQDRERGHWGAYLPHNPHGASRKGRLEPFSGDGRRAMGDPACPRPRAAS